MLDLAALEDGQLSSAGMGRLAIHVAHCQTCMAVFQSMLDDAGGAAGSGPHQLRAWLASDWKPLLPPDDSCVSVCLQ